MVNKVVTAFGDMLKLTVMALSTLDGVSSAAPFNKETTMFTRYFQLDQLDRVRANYKRLLGLKVPECPGPVTRATYLEVFWRNQPEWMDYDPFSGDDHPGQNALTSQDPDTGRAAILLCPLAFQPPFPESLDSILDNHCNTIGDNADVDMDVPGGTFLHERESLCEIEPLLNAFSQDSGDSPRPAHVPCSGVSLQTTSQIVLHWGIMSDAHGEDYFNPDDGWVLDWNDPQNPSFDPKQNPPNGYGPYVSNPWLACCCDRDICS